MQANLSSGRIGIRRYRAEDMDDLYAAVRESVAELLVWMAWCSPDYSRAESEAFVASRDAEWDKGGHYSWVIHDRESGRFLGGVGLNFINRAHGFANLGYWVRTSEWGRGAASTATRLVAQAGLGEMGFQRLEIVTAVGNLGSQRVAENVGARREGILRRRLLIHGSTHDAVMFSLVKEDLVRNGNVQH